MVSLTVRVDPTPPYGKLFVILFKGSLRTRNMVIYDVKPFFTPSLTKIDKLVRFTDLLERGSGNPKKSG